MRQSHIRLLSAAVIAAASSVALAVPIIDGQRDAEYGTPIVVQTTGTQFGDVTTAGASPLQAPGGSEIDAAYGLISGGKLHLFFAGNLESNFNKFDIFIDSHSGGQNQLRGNNPDVEFNNLNRMGDDGTANGLKFDAGFEADHFFTLTNGNLPVETYSSYSDIRTLGGGNGTYIGTNGGGDNPLLDARVNGDAGNPLLGVQWGLNNTNVAGVGPFGTADVSDPATVATGVEIVIPLTYLEDPTGPIRVIAFINGSSHDYLSNQIIAPVPVTQGNLADPRLVDFSAIAGDQFFTLNNAAASNQWGASASGDFSDTTKWTGGAAPLTVDNSVILGGSGAAVAVNVDAPVVTNRLVMSGRDYSLSGAGSLNLNGLNFAAVSVASGTHSIAVPVTLSKNVQFNVETGASLSLTGSVDYAQKYVEKVGAGALNVPNVRTSTFAVYGGTLKVTDNTYSSAKTVLIGVDGKVDLGGSALLIDYDDVNTPLATVVDHIKNSRLVGTAGSGRAIGTADTASLVTLTSYAGQPLDATAVVAVSTLKGDSDLNKTVDFDDLLRLAQNYDAAGSGKLWINGDSDYNGVVDFDDLLSLAQNYGGTALANGTTLFDEQLHSQFASDFALALSMVPEPASLAAIGMGGLMLGRRRK